MGREMSRIAFAARILRPFNPSSILDIGCRNAELGKYFPEADYNGADLFPSPGVKYVGDITTMEFDRSFDTVVACDILEHLETTSATFDKLMGLAEKRLLISLPNTYDLKSRWSFAAEGRLGGKYEFNEEPPLDRHHWIMGREEIRRFAQAKARKHGTQLEMFDLTYGSSGNRTLSAVVGRVLSKALPKSLTTETVLALFTR